MAHLTRLRSGAARSSRPPRVRAGSRRGRGLLLGAVAFFLLVLTVATVARSASPPTPVVESGGAVPFLTSAATSLPARTLNTAVAPQAICAQNATGCPAGTGVARVELSASANGAPTETWPAVQVVFVIETTAYDGDLGTDRSDTEDQCANSNSIAPACEESNGIPFFVANAQLIANSIQGANPHSAVSFALVDYYDARGEVWDDTDGPEYEVDIGSFVPAYEFGPLVVGTFQQNVLGGGWYAWDQDLDNNFLDSSSIAALYGAIVGSQLNWTANAHHVVVWMGSTAPRDPRYPENYCVSPSEWNVWANNLPCYSQTCEPSYTFEAGASPNCEGWVQSQDGNPNDSIARLAHIAPGCVDSIGGVCTIDTIDLWTTTTDPYSAGWPSGSSFVKEGGGAGGTAVLTNTEHVLQAGCDMAAATGGTWSGPEYFSCADGQQGNLQYTNFGKSIYSPNTNNPTLLQAFKSIGFGPVYGNLVARGGDQPIFQYVPYGAIQVAPDPQWSTACITPTGFGRDCQKDPTIFHEFGLTVYGWNWSTDPALNNISLGDGWAVTFNVIATGPPYAVVPVDACTTIDCKAEGSGSLAGLYTWAHYLAPAGSTATTQSFPLGQVDVELPESLPTSPGVPPPFVPPIPGLPIVIAPTIPVAAPVPVLTQLGIGTVSLQATAAGFLGAGFTAVGLKNRPIAMKVAAKSGIQRSKFDAVPKDDAGIGRFE